MMKLQIIAQKIRVPAEPASAIRGSLDGLTVARQGKWGQSRLARRGNSLLACILGLLGLVMSVGACTPKSPGAKVAPGPTAGPAIAPVPIDNALALPVHSTPITAPQGVSATDMAPGAEEEPVPAAASADGAPIVTAINDWIVACNHGDWTAAAQILAEPTEQSWPRQGGGPPTVGKDAVVAAWQELAAVFDHAQWTVHRVIVAQDRVAIQLELSGIQKKNWHGRPATHNSSVLQLLTVLTLSKGKVQSAHWFGGWPINTAKPGIWEAFSAVTGPSSDLVSRLTRFLFAGLTASDSATYDQLFAEELHGVDFLSGATADGPTANKAAIEAFRAPFPRIRVEHVEVAAAGPWAVGVAEVHLLHKGTWGKWAPTGRALTLHVGQILRFSDGKLVQRWQYADGDELVQQIEKSPQP